MTQMGVVMERETEREWVWREGFGWVERPVEVPVVEVEQDDSESVAA